MSDAVSGVDSASGSRATYDYYMRLLRDYGIVAGIVILFVVLAILSPRFLTTSNLLNILDQATPVGIIAIGVTLVIIAGGFDLSTAAVYAFAGVVAANVTNTAGVATGILAGLLAGLAFGVINGLIVAYLKINSFVATLATGLMIRGLASVVTGGLIVTVSDPLYRTVGRNTFFGATYSVYIFGGLAVVASVILWKTAFGRYIYAAGGNAEAARLSGVRVALIRAATFTVSGVFAAAAGIVASSRVASGQADAGVGLELTAIAAIVIGGTSIMGGEGAIWRTVLGVLLLALISNGFNLMNVDPFYRDIFHGGVILLAVGVDAIARIND